MSAMRLSLNDRAAALAEAMAAEAARLRIAVSTVGGARVLDCGVNTEGSLEAGRCLAEVCLAGLATVSITSCELDGLWLPAVEITTDHPVAACLASQYAGWSIEADGYRAMGSGPARALARAERELFAKIEGDTSDRAVLVLEARALPTDRVVAVVAERCGVRPANLAILVAPTASVAGCVQIAARSVETGLHKMLALSFDPRQVRSGIGLAPIAPVAGNDLQAIGWTNDCILYGARAWLAVNAADDVLAALIGRLPASASSDYGVPFAELFERYGRDFYKIDPLLFSPAQVTLNNLASGRVYSAGRVDAGILRRSLGPR
jgi:methenyltetrahydromethanopterin cyclohydrolase